MLPLRELIYRCLELLSESVTSSTAVGWRRCWKYWLDRWRAAAV